MCLLVGVQILSSLARAIAAPEQVAARVVEFAKFIMTW
jgi:hypothetical protein